jgi:hypothetical protein
MAQATETKRDDERPAVGWFRLGEAPLDEQRGQVILVTARWVLIVVAAILSLNAPDTLIDLQVSIGGLLLLAGVNFVLHTNLMMKRESSSKVLYWTSVGDIVGITAIVAITGGQSAYAFVFYYPALLAFSLALPLRVTTLLTICTVVGYTGTVLLVSADTFQADPDGFASTLVTRLITFIAVMFVANMYRWVEFKRLEDETELVAPPQGSSNRTATAPNGPSIKTEFAS